MSKASEAAAILKGTEIAAREYEAVLEDKRKSMPAISFIMRQGDRLIVQVDSAGDMFLSGVWESLSPEDALKLADWIKETFGE